MVKSSISPPLDSTFGALADPTRRRILDSLKKRELSTSQLALRSGMSLPGVLKHLRVLEQAGLVVGQKQGRVRHYSLRAAPLSDATSWLEEYRQFWESRIDALENYLKESPGNE